MRDPAHKPKPRTASHPHPTSLFFLRLDLCYKNRVMSLASAVTQNAPQSVTNTASSQPAKVCVDMSMICPNCSAKLHSHRCKAICKKCGFYLSCSDPW